MLIDDVVWLLPRVLPLVSAALWALIGFGASGRYGGTSPFVRALTLFGLLVSAACLVDWYMIVFVNAGDANLARIVIEVRTSLFAVASLVILLASKWISLGHSWYDPLFALPVVGSIGLIWAGMYVSVSPSSWGPQFGRNLLNYGLFVVQEVAYFITAAILALNLLVRRRDLPRRLRRPAYLSVGALLAFVALLLPTNVFTAFVQTGLPPLFTSVLSIPALMIALAYLGRTREEMGEIFRAVSEVEHRLLALYVFYRSGEPLVAVGSARSLPIDAEQLQGVLDLVGNFVETSMRKFRGYATTSMRFERMGILAVRGEFAIVAAVYEEAAYDALRSELQRSLETFEANHREELATLDGASRIADVVADDLFRLLKSPSPRSRA